MEVVAPVSPDLLRHGLESHRRGDFDQAARCYQQALAVEPMSADAWHLLGVIAHQQGDHANAVEHIRRALAINESVASYHSNLAVACRSLGRSAEALTAIRRALELDPSSSGMRLNLANILKDASKFDDAAHEYRLVLDQEADHSGTWSGLGDALRGLEEFEESQCCHERAIELAPRSAECYYDFGLMLRDAGRLSEAIQCFLKATSFRPDFFDAHLNLANTYEDLGEFTQAQHAYDRALRLRPEAPAARFNRALASLRAGDLEHGWHDYEWRWRHNGKPRKFAEPEWDGSANAIRTVLVYSEQGIGDAVMFASCFNEVIARSGRCLIECEPRLVRLFARSFPAAQFYPRSGEIDPRAAGIPAWDAQIAAGSLPRLLRPNFASFPQQAGYLKVDAGQLSDWQQRFERLGAGLTVGIAWRGGKDPATRRRRSTLLQQWSPLFQVPGIAFINLQYGECAGELEAVHQECGVNIHDWADADPLSDLDKTAAQIAALDLVISVDSATVHLAGALNVPVWNLLPFAADWRWFADPTASVWYPSMRLFRQPAAEGSAEQNWDEVFRQVTSELSAFTKTHAAAEYNRAVEFHGQGALAEAIVSYRRAAVLRPDDGQTLNDLGVAWKDAGRTDFAEAAYRQALEVAPRSPMIWFNLGNAHREENRLEEAVHCYRQALEMTPTDHKILVNLSVALRDLRRFDESLECLERVLAASPELPAARFDRALVWLTRGELDRGWDEYEWRLPSEARPTSARAAERWDGRSLAGRPLRIRAEQGIGDQVLFASCLSEVVATVRSCVVECDSRLVPLFARSFPQIEFVANASKGGETQTEFKFADDGDQANPSKLVEFIGSLPRHTRRRLEDFPQTSGYLIADPQRVAIWRDRLSRSGRALRVGISWRGGKDRETQRKRSIPLEHWEPLFQVPGVRFVNLQHGHAAMEAAEARQRFGIALDDGSDCDPLVDLDDFAAKISALDLVISADNSTVHLAAALGLPVWTMLPFSADWRWMLAGESTPWYPTMRLLWCQTADDWSEVLRRASRMLTRVSMTR